MKKLLAIALFLLPMVASASEEQVYVNDEKYLINAEEKTATLDKCSDASGDYVIPESVEYEGVTYTVTAISGLAFSNSEITSVVIPNTVTLIYGSAFNDCKQLTSVYIPASVTHIRWNPFEGCISLTSIKVDEANPVYDSRNDCNAIIETATNKLVSGCQATVIPEGITTIGESAFEDITTLTSVKFPESLVTIEEHAFTKTGLSEVILPDNVEILDRYAFKDVDASRCIIGRKLAKIGSFALTCHFTHIYCYADVVPETEDAVFYYDIDKYQTLLHVPEALLENYKTTAPWKDFPTIVALKEDDPTSSNPSGEGDAVEIDGLYYFLYDTKKAVVTYNPSVPTNEGCYSGDVIIPASVTYEGVDYDVTGIGNYTFQYSENLTSVTIPEGVTSIGEAAFQQCFSLTSMTLPNSVTSIGEYAFNACANLTSINIPDNVTRIEESTFRSCDDLKTINLPDGLTSIGNNAFTFCMALNTLTIPNSVNFIGKKAFYGSSIVSINIPDNVTIIREMTFDSCINLRTVTIGKGHKEVYEDCFTLCVTLTDVYCQSEGVPFTAISAFNNCDLSKVKLHVPERLIDDYKSTEPWKQFGTIVALTDEETGIRSINGDGSSEMLRYTLDGRRLNAPQKGLNIIKTRNGQTRKVLVK